MNPYQSPGDNDEYNHLYDPTWWFLQILKWTCVTVFYTACLPIFLVIAIITILLGFCYLSVAPTILLAKGRRPLPDDIGACCFCWIIIIAVVTYWYLYLSYNYDYIEHFIEFVVSPLRRSLRRRY